MLVSFTVSVVNKYTEFSLSLPLSAARPAGVSPGPVFVHHLAVGPRNRL